MRKTLWLVLLLPLVAMAVTSGTVTRVTSSAITGFEKAPLRTPRPVSRPPAADVPETYVGKVDTIGGSTYDVEFNGAPSQTIYFDTTYGLHAIWMFSTDLGTTYPERNMRYNFLPKGDSVWRFNTTGPFMDWGYNAFTGRAGFGMLDVNAADGTEYIDAHQAYGSTPTYYPSIVRDEAGPGQGGFVACTGTPTCDNYLWPAMGISPNGKIHVMVILDPARTDLYYTTVDPWCTWAVPTDWPPPGPEPRTPDYNVAVSKVSDKVAVCYVEEPPTGMWVAYYKTSPDNGATWSDPVTLEPPDIYNIPPDTAPMLWATSLYPYFDNNDSLHFAATINKSIQESMVSTGENAIADWSTAGGWHIIDSITSDTVVTHGGTFYEPFADRVSMAIEGKDTFVAVWEQFDGHNIDLATNESRSDIWASASFDAGVTWTQPCSVAFGGQVSRRFPCAARNMDHGFLDIIYLQDNEAGPAVPPQSLGDPTVNPFVHQRLPVSLTGVSEARISRPGSYLCQATPNVFRGATRISYTLPRTGKVNLKIYDAVGRPVRTLVSSQASAGQYTTSWNGRTDAGIQAASGVYFYTLSTEKTSTTKKLTLLP